MAANWYYMLKGKRSGPITARALRDLVNSGVLSEDSLVWKEGLENWLPVARLRSADERETRRPSADTGAAPDSQPQSPPANDLPEADSVPVFTSSVPQRSSEREFVRYEPARRSLLAHCRRDIESAFLFVAGQPVRLMLVMLVCDITSLLCLAGIVTALLTPVFWIGYTRYLYGLLKQTSPSYRDLIVFMRHGWDSLWHLAMLFAAMIVTVSLVLCAALLCLLLLCSIYSGVVVLAALTGDADVPHRANNPRLILRDPPMAPGHERGDRVEGNRTGWWDSLSNWWSKHFWNLVTGSMTIPIFFGRTLVTLLLLDVALAQRREGPERFDVAYDAFGHMLDASRRNWGRLLLEGVGLYLLFTFVTIGIPTLIGLLGITEPHSVLTQDLLPLLLLSFVISIDVFSKALAFVAAASLRDQCPQQPAGVGCG